MNEGKVNELVSQYVGMWHEADPARRREVVRSLFADSRGLDILVLREDGRIRSLYQFLEPDPAAYPGTEGSAAATGSGAHSASPANGGSLPYIWLWAGFRVSHWRQRHRFPVRWKLAGGRRRLRRARWKLPCVRGKLRACEAAHHGSSRGGGEVLKLRSRRTLTRSQHPRTDCFHSRCDSPQAGCPMRQSLLRHQRVHRNPVTLVTPTVRCAALSLSRDQQPPSRVEKRMDSGAQRALG